MSSETALQSETLLYGLMLLNVLVCAAGALWCWRRGHFTGDSEMADVLFAPDDDRQDRGTDNG